MALFILPAIFIFIFWCVCVFVCLVEIMKENSLMNKGHLAVAAQATRHIVREICALNRHLLLRPHHHLLLRPPLSPHHHPLLRPHHHPLPRPALRPPYHPLLSLPCPLLRPLLKLLHCLFLLIVRSLATTVDGVFSSSIVEVSLYNYTRCTYSQCMPCAYLWTDTCASLSRCCTCFETVGHVQQSVNSVRRIEKHSS